MQAKLLLDPNDLPREALALCDDPHTGDLFRSAKWLTEVAVAGLQPGDRLRILLCQDDAALPATVALLPAVYSRLYGSHPGARVLHFLQREEQPYAPIGHDLDLTEVAQCLVRKLGETPKAFDVVRVSPFNAGQRFTEVLVPALRRCGYWVQLYYQARSHYAAVAGQNFAQYLAQRPRALRELLDLNTRLLMQGGRGAFHFPCTPELLDDAWDTICMVVDRAPVEDAPDSLAYLHALMMAAAQAGALRAGIFSLDGEPVAIQLWVINGRVARCLRIWGAQGQRTFPIDDVLTQMVALCLIDGDKVEELEFGDVSEEFAQDWAPQARERLALAAFNRRTARGVQGALRHITLPWLTQLPRRLWSHLLGKRLPGRP